MIVSQDRDGLSEAERTALGRRWLAGRLAWEHLLEQLRRKAAVAAAAS